MSKARIEWQGVNEMMAKTRQYQRAIHDAIRALADYLAPVLEAYAKQNAPWTDRTGNARQTLQGFTRELSREAVAVYLAHGMEYGKWLELRFAGKWAVIWPTIEQHIPEIERRLKEIFR